MAPEKKRPVSFRLSDDTADLLRMFAQSMGTSQAAVVEMSVREKALRHGKETIDGFLKWYRGLPPETKAELQKRLR